jgi:lipoprotein NlpD
VRRRDISTSAALRFCLLAGVLLVCFTLMRCAYGPASSLGYSYDYSNGWYHKIAEGETLFAIARRYGRDVNLLAHLNGVRDAYHLPVGHYLYIPPTNIYPPSLKKELHASASVESGGTQPAPVSKGNGRERILAPSRTPVVDQQVKKSKRNYGFIYPVRGRIIRWFSGNPKDIHKGIDIAAPEGTPVVAARSGKVIYSGDKIPGYGNLIIVDHGDGFATLYGNNQRNLVTRINQRIRRGDRIALVGRGDKSEPSHLHFEIRKDSIAVNPLVYFP